MDTNTDHISPARAYACEVISVISKISKISRETNVCPSWPAIHFLSLCVMQKEVFDTEFGAEWTLYPGLSPPPPQENYVE